VPQPFRASIRVDDPAPSEEDARLEAFAPRRLRDRRIELPRVLVERSLSPLAAHMTPDRHAAVVEDGVAEHVVDVQFQVHRDQRVAGPRRGGVPVDRLRRERTRAGVRHQRGMVATHKPGVHLPRRREPESGDPDPKNYMRSVMADGLY
jgi:hypothetical protein